MLIERDAPLQRLFELTTLATRGRGSIALVSGEPGIGKTAMLERFREIAEPEHRFVRGGCDPLDTPRVLGPLHDMKGCFDPSIQRLLAEDASIATLVPALLAQLESSLSPIVLVFEDAHWADKATLDLLKCIGRRIALLKTVLVVSYRLGEVGPEHPLTHVIGDFPQARTHRVELQPLSRGGVEKLAAAAQRSAADIHRTTGGNPFFVTELLADAGAGSTPVPASVQDAISSRLNRLPAALREFLETVSVIPYAIDVELLNRLPGGQGELLAADCLRRNLLREETDGSVRFRHELARLGTRERLLPPVKRQIHAMLLALSDQLGQADRIDRSRHLDKLVCHAVGACDGERVLAYAPLAARRASKAGAHAEAASHFAAALEFVALARPELAATLHESWAYESGLVQIDDRTIEARQAALALWRTLNRPDKIGENLRWLSRLHWYRGESQCAARYADEAVQVLESTSASAERAMAYSLKSQLHMLNDRMQDAVYWGRLALEVESRHASVEVRIHASNNIGTALIFQDRDSGLEHLRTSLSLSLEHDLHEHAARVYTNLSDYAVSCRDFVLAEQTIADGIAFDTSHDLDSWTHYLVGYLAQLRMEQGRLDEAETISQGVMDLQNQTLLMTLPALLVLSRTKLRRGDKGAQTLLDNALENALNIGEMQYIAPARFALIEAAWLRGDDASVQFERLLSEDIGSVRAWRRGELAVWMHRFGMGELSVDATLPAPYRLEIGGDPDAATDAWLKIGSPYEAALTLLSGARSRANRFQRAQTLLESVLAHGPIDKLRQLADAAGVLDQLPQVRRGPRKASRQHPLGLTGKEQQIMPLIVEGLSNREIAERLSRSVRTVENHVSSILRKLNVTNRMEAMLRVRSEPWLTIERTPNAGSSNNVRSRNTGH